MNPNPYQQQFINIDDERNPSKQQQQQIHQNNQQDQNINKLDQLRNNYREQDRIKNDQHEQQNQYQQNKQYVDSRKQEILSKMVEDYKQLKDQSINIQQQNEMKLQELQYKINQQDQQIQSLMNENASLHNYYQRAELLLQQQKQKIEELENKLQIQSNLVKDNNINNHGGLSQQKQDYNNEAMNYLSTLPNDELIDLIKLKRKIDFDNLLQKSEQSQLPLINGSQPNPITFVRPNHNRHQRSSSTFRNHNNNVQYENNNKNGQLQIIRNQSKIIDKLLNHSLQNQTMLQKELLQNQNQQASQIISKPQIDFIKEQNSLRQLSTSRLRNRSSYQPQQNHNINQQQYQQNNNNQLEQLQRSIESKDRLILDMHNLRIKQEKDDQLINFFNKQSSYLIESNYDKKLK